jgi:hypothetical protein
MITLGLRETNPQGRESHLELRQSDHINEMITLSVITFIIIPICSGSHLM